MKKLTVLAVVAVCVLVAGNTMALNLSDILGSGYGSYGDTGAEIFALNETDGSGDEDAVAYLFLESAGFADGNKFGIYDIGTGVELEIFDGAVGPIDSATLTFDIGAGTVTNDFTGNSAAIGTTFGFYLAAQDGNKYFSQSSLNAGGFDALLAFDTSDHAVSKLLGSDVVLAWEDLGQNGDGDFNDMVVGIHDIKPVPEPGTLLLLGAGLLGLVGLRKRVK